MARFYASIHGNSGGQVTRTGRSGIAGHLRGWDTGVQIDVDPCVQPELIAPGGTGDYVNVSRTGGSNGGSAADDTVAWVDDGPAAFKLNGITSDQCHALARKLGAHLDRNQWQGATDRLRESEELLRQAFNTLAVLAHTPIRRTTADKAA